MKEQFRKMTYPYVIWISIMVLLPMLLIVLYAFTTYGNETLTLKFTLQNFKAFLTDTTFLQVLTRSLMIAAVTTVLCILLGYPMAYMIAQLGDAGNIIVILLITMPTWINMLVHTYAWMGMLQDGGLINQILSLIGIGPLKLIHTTTAVIIGMVYNFIPFMILQIHASLASMDKDILNAAADLGANQLQRFYRIILPLSIPGVLSGVMLVFLPAVSSFFIPRFLGGGQFVLIGNIIETQFLTAGDWNIGSAISLIMVVLIMVSIQVTKRINQNERTQG